MDAPKPRTAFLLSSELRARVITGAALAMAAFVFLLVGGLFFNMMVLFAAILMHGEWRRLTEGESRTWQLFGYVYVLLPTATLLILRSMGFSTLYLTDQAASADEALKVSPFLALYPIAVVIATDIGAYFAGRLIGGPRLIPSVSPHKTWAGLLGGVVAATLVGAALAAVSPFPRTWLNGLWLGAVLAVVAQAGDFFESWLKRRAGVKDSGEILPGHGGILDRVDGYIFTLPVFTLLAWLAGGRLP